MARRKSQLKLIDPSEAAPRRRNRINLFELAYQRIEDLLVNCTLKPGRYLTMQDLQDLTGFGRTPFHHAVNRLAADTLINIRPRHGLQIAPIDLARERMLLNLRRDIERFVIRLATERSGPSHRNQLLHMERVLRERRNTLDAGRFQRARSRDRPADRVDRERAVPRTYAQAAAHAVPPIGYIHHTYMPGQSHLDGTVDHHLAVLNAVANRHVDRAVAASDALMDFVDSMFDVLEVEIDPSLLDSSIEPLLGV